MSVLPDGFEELADRVITGQASDEEVAAFRAFLKDDADLLDEYIGQMRVHSGLVASVRLSARCRSGAQDDASGSSEAVAVGDAPLCRGGAARAGGWGKRRGWMAAAAAAALLAGLSAVWRGERSAPSPAGGARAPSRAAISPVTLVSQIGASALSLPGALPGTLRLAAGVAKVRLPSGVELSLQGPAEVWVESGMETHLKAGELLAWVPKRASGFTVRAPGLTAWDVGTIFSVSADAEGSSLFVFKGQVQVLDETGEGIDLCEAGEGVLALDGWTPIKVTSGETEPRELFAAVRGERAWAAPAAAVAAARRITRVWGAKRLPVVRTASTPTSEENTMRKRNAGIRNAAAGAALAAVMTAAEALSVNVTWQGPVEGAGEWSVTNNWPAGTLPAPDDYVYVPPSRTAVVGEATTATVTRVYVENSSLGAGVLRLDGGVLTNVAIITVGTSASASHTGRLEIVRGFCQSSPTGNLTVGDYGRVDMTGGEVSNATITIGGNGNRFTQDGGTNRVTALYVGYNGVGSGQYLLNGGLLDSPGVIIGAGNYGQKGYMEMNGGALSPIVSFQIPQNTLNSGELVLNHVTNAISGLYIAGGGNGTRHSYTGSVTMTGCDIALTYLEMGNKTSNCCARLLIDGGKLWYKGGPAIPNVGGNQAILTLTNGATLLVSSTEDIALSANRNLTVGNGGELRIHGGTVRIQDRLFMYDGGKIEMTDGVFVPGRVFSGGGGPTSPCVFYMKGGLFAPIGDFLLGGDGNSTPTSNSQIPVTFIQTGGTVSNTTVQLSVSSTNAVSRYEISGGALAPNLAFRINVSNVSELCVKGSAPDVTMSYIYDPNARSFLLECVLDKSLGHLAPMRFTSSAGYRCGHLRARLDGGVLLSASDTFTVMKKLSGTFTDARNYLSVPDSGLWVTSLVAGATESAITLAGKQAELVMHGAQSASFAAVPMGHVTVGNVATNFLVELIVRMRATAADGSEITPEGLTALAEGLVDAGYTNSAAETSGIYNLKVAVPQAYVAPGSAFFAWDFTRTAGIKTVGTVTTNALVNAVSVEAVKAISTGTVIFVL